MTGASRGIGAEIARMLAGEGYELFLLCRNSEEKIEALKQQIIETYQVSCHTFLCDVSDPKQVETVFSQIKEVDVLVNNAAVSYVGLLTDMTVKQWQQVIGTNLCDVFFYRWT